MTIAQVVETFREGDTDTEAIVAARRTATNDYILNVTTVNNRERLKRQDS